MVETISGPAGAVASGGVYAISDDPDPNPFVMAMEAELFIYTRSGRIGGAGRGISIWTHEASYSQSSYLMEDRLAIHLS